MTRRYSQGNKARAIGLFVAATCGAGAIAQTTSPDVPTASQGRGGSASAPIVPGTGHAQGGGMMISG